MIKKIVDIFVGFVAKCGFGKIPGFSRAYKNLYQLLFYRGVSKITVDGIIMVAPANKAGFTQKIGGERLYEPLISKFFMSAVGAVGVESGSGAGSGSGATVLDVGAHVGYYSFLAARAAGLNGKIFSAEAISNSMICCG